MNAWLFVPLYLALGLTCVAGLYLLNWILERRDDAMTLPTDLSATQPEKQHLPSYLTSLVMFLLLWPIWLLLPIALAAENVHRVIARTLTPDATANSSTAADDEPESAPYSTLRAQHGTLLAPLAMAEIEVAATHPAELDGVPHLPFGHLHGAWNAFKARRMPDDEVWRFTAAPHCYLCPSVLDSGPQATRVTGYAALRNGTIVDEFIDGYD